MKREIEGDLRQVLKPYLGHWDVPEGGDLVLTIDRIYEEEVRNQHGSENKPVMYFREPDTKPMIVNKVNNDTITKVHGKRTKTNTWAGKKIALYEAKEPKSQDGLALRVREYIPKSNELYCEVCGELIQDATIDGKTYKAKAIANNALTKFGKYMCYDCAKSFADDYDHKRKTDAEQEQEVENE